MAPTPQAHQGSPPSSPGSGSVTSPVQGVAYSKPGSGPQHNSLEAHAVNTRLAEELRSVIIMNDKWQKFYKQQEKFVAELQGKLDQQKMLTREAEKKYSQAAATHSLLQQKVKDQRATIDSFGALMDELDSAREKITKLEGEVRDLRGKEQQTDQQRREGGSEKEHILQLQLQLCIDDFKNEKKEKEKFQKEVCNLSKQLEDANALLEDYQEKVAIMRSINFPRLQNNNSGGPGAIPRDKHTVYRKRNRMSSSAPDKCGISCRLDGLVNFPTAIEADFADPNSRGLPVELAPKFSSSLDSDEETSILPDPGTFDESVELVRH